MSKNVKENRFRTNVFYKQIVPEEIRPFISKNEFYSNLEHVISLARLEGVPITPTMRKIVNLRFVKDMTVAEIQDELNLSPSEYTREMNMLINKMSVYYTNNVAPYPLRVVILNTLNLKNKFSVRSIYKIVPETKMKVITFIRVASDEITGKTNEKFVGYRSALYLDNPDAYCPEKSVKELNRLYDLITDMVKDDKFLKYITTKEKTKKQTIVNTITKIDEYISKNDIFVNM